MLRALKNWLYFRFYSFGQFFQRQGGAFTKTAGKGYNYWDYNDTDLCFETCPVKLLATARHLKRFTHFTHYCGIEALPYGIDEPSWFENGKLKWLWTMATKNVCFFLVHPNQFQKAFEALNEDWRGILINNDYGVYKNWINHRQLCLAHLIRSAKALSERKDESVQHFGTQLTAELKHLCQAAYAIPNQKQWTDFYSRLILFLLLLEGADDDADKLASRVLGELDSLWVFLDESDVEPTNNRAERVLRFGVLWRKRSNGTQSQKANRWVECILSVRQNYRHRSEATFQYW